MQTFNETYGSIVSEYIQQHKAQHVIIDGIIYYNSDDSIFCTHPAPEYRLPSDIQELLETPAITKLHGYDLTMCLEMAPQWHTMRIRNIGGIEMQEFYHGDISPCSHCGTDVNEHSHWCLHDLTLCSMCYERRSDITEGEWEHVYDPDMNFLDYVQFMQELEENSVCSGSAYYVNCNPASKNYGKIMVTTCDGHGRQRFDVLYRNVEHMLRDIYTWIVTVPSAFSSDELIEQYSYQDWFEIDPEDIPTDQELELNVSDWKHMTDVLDSPADKWLVNNAVEHGVIKKGDILTNRIILENMHRLRHVEDVDTKLQEIIAYHTGHRELQRSNGIKVKQVGPSGSSKSIAEITDEEIIEKSKKELQTFLETPIFGVHYINGIYRSMKRSTTYGNPCYQSFTVWYRILYDLEFDWG